MAGFKEKLWYDYPIPSELSIFGGNDVTTAPIKNLDVLIDSVVDEVASDILMVGYIEGTGMATHMPEGTVNVCSASLSAIYPFQGNRLVKATYDSSKNICFLRYYPATITYQRKLLVSDLDTLTGDNLLYVRDMALWKMATQELGILKSVNMTLDNGAIDLAELERYRDEKKSRVETLKTEILIYSSAL